MDIRIFIQANRSQALGAKLSEYSLRKFLTNGDSVRITIINFEDRNELKSRHRQFMLRRGKRYQFLANDLQSFTLLRFLPPELCDWRGIALVIDPDVFAVKSIDSLYDIDMQGHAILARKVNSPNGNEYSGSSVMLLDCSKLRHWNWNGILSDLFDGKIDYQDLMQLKLEDPRTIGELSVSWNEFDSIKEGTKLLHTTMRNTQPWKTGLPVEFHDKLPRFGKLKLILARTLPDRLIGLTGITRDPQFYCQPHPNKDVELFFMRLLHSALRDGYLSKSFVQGEIDRGFIRPDIWQVIERAVGNELDLSHLSKKANQVT